MKAVEKTKTNPRIFISHSSHDRDTAHKILQFLESQGRQCWIAPRDIPPGAGWTESIMEGLSYSTVIVLIVSKSVNDSPHVRREIEYAVSSKIPIIPILIEDISISKWLEYCISSHQWMNFSKGAWDENLQLLWSALMQEKKSLHSTLKVDRRTRKFPSLKKIVSFIKIKANQERKINPTNRILIFKSALIGFLIGFIMFLTHLTCMSYIVADDSTTAKENVLDLIPRALPESLGVGIFFALLAIIVVKIWISKYSLAKTFIIASVLSFVPFQVLPLLYSKSFYETIVFTTPLIIPISCIIGIVAAFNKYVAARWMAKYSISSIQILGTILSYIFIHSLTIYVDGIASISDKYGYSGGNLFWAMGVYFIITIPILYIPCSLVGTISAIAKIGVEKWTAASK